MRWQLSASHDFVLMQFGPTANPESVGLVSGAVSSGLSAPVGKEDFKHVYTIGRGMVP
jgi:hypothetical protein